MFKLFARIIQSMRISRQLKYSQAFYHLNRNRDDVLLGIPVHQRILTTISITNGTAECRTNNLGLFWRVGKIGLDKSCSRKRPVRLGFVFEFARKFRERLVFSPWPRGCQTFQRQQFESECSFQAQVHEFLKATKPVLSSLTEFFQRTRQNGPGLPLSTASSLLPGYRGQMMSQLPPAENSF